MPTRYYLSPDGRTAMEAGDGPLATAVVPDGYREVTGEEYAAVIEAGRQEADERAAHFIANDGAVPGDEEPQDGPVPVDEITPAPAVS